MEQPLTSPVSRTEPPLVTIVTATRNAEKTLAACLESVRAQDYPRIEHLILDSVSTDSTLDIIEAHAWTGLRCISERDKGIYDAWNKGIAAAQGEWISFLGADDLYLPGAISAYMRLAASHPRAEYLSGRVRWIPSQGQPRIIGTAWSWPRFARYMCVAHVGSMHRRSLYAQYGTYNDNLRMVGDYEFLLRPGAGLKAAFLPEITADVQAGGVTDSTAALDETAYVKRTTAKRSSLLVRFERILAEIIFRVRRAARKIG